jgi:SpoIID/LytB domain protein
MFSFLQFGAPRRRALVVASVALATLFAPTRASAAVKASPYGATITVAGRGNGHGRGLGQYGAYGYAVDFGWSSAKILDRYYGGTTAGVIDPAVLGTISVRLTAFDGLDAVVMNSGGHLITSAAPGEFTALRVSRTDDNSFAVYSGTGCDGGPAGWVPLTTVTGAAPQKPIVTFDATGRVDNGPVDSLLSVCQNDGQRRWYRGVLSTTLDPTGSARTVNTATVESYLRGVVPRESPASWGDAGSGRGMAALRAQAVAARSYALSERRYLPYAQTCDTQACQVYGGAGLQQSPGATVLALEDRRSDQAVSDTTSQVRFNADGTIARTEFSSSTGGWTAGGAFPSVEDLGDATSINPFDTWQVSLSRSAVESAFPDIGDLLLIDVTKRNGIGPFGGRVVSAVIRGTRGATGSLSGDEVRKALGLKSDWFFVASPFSTAPAVALATAASGGYWLASTEGGVFNFGGVPYAGSMLGTPLVSPVIGIAPAGTTGYWLLASDGGVFSFGSAAFYGSTGGTRLNKPIVAMAARPSGDGYWFVGSDGGVFAFGQAPFLGSMGGRLLAKPIVGMAATPTGNGYWLVASDGGIFAYGDAQFYGSMGGTALNKPVVAMAATRTGRGYWMVASDGGIFSFGDAQFFGSPAPALTKPVVSMSPTATGRGYRLVAADGTVLGFGDAT